MTDNKEKYSEFLKKLDYVPLFAEKWWLDAVCGDKNWSVALAFDKQGGVEGALPYHFTVQKGFSTTKQPILTPYLYPIILTKENLKTHQKNAQERSIFGQIADKIPHFSFFSQLYAPEFTNFLPFFWQKYKAEPLVTHIISDLSDSQKLFDNFKENVQKKIKKAQKMGLEVSITDDIGLVYDIYEELLGTIKNRKMSYSKAFLTNLHQKIQENKAGALYKVVDTEGGIHAALYIVWDAKKAYYWLGGAAVKYRNSGALTFLLWEIFKDLGARGIPSFDFVGSNLENLESFFSAFGAEKKVFFKLYRYKNRFWQFLFALRDILRNN